MHRSRRLAVAATIFAVLTTGCSAASAGAPQWTFGAPATPDAAAAVASSAPASPSPLAAPAATPAGSMAGMAGMAGASAATASPAAAAAPSADPNAAAYVLRDPKAPAVLAGTVHDIDLPIVEKDMTVATGVRRPRLDVRRHRAGARRSASTWATRSAST